MFLKQGLLPTDSELGAREGRVCAGACFFAIDGIACTMLWDVVQIPLNYCIHLPSSTLM